MARERRLDLLLAAAIIAAEISNLWLVSDGAGHRDLPTIALLAASAAPLVCWRRSPFAVSFVCASATVALAVLGDPHLGLGVIASTFGVALWAEPVARRVALASLIIGVPLVPLLTDDAASIPKDVALYGAAWILGTLLRERRISTEALRERAHELEREREEKALLAAEAERTRIARELHDVLTHSMSVMVVQAQAAQAALGDDARVAGALARIESVGKESLIELRRLLQRVRSDDESAPLAPAPGLAQLDALVDEVRAAGLDVSVSREGEARPLPAGIDLSAYRIVQEALTNTLRHAGGVATKIVLRYLPDEFVLEVRDDGQGSPRPPDGGNGLSGMRERVALVGGSLEAEEVPGGGFRVAARMPLQVTP
jgi:signal transduction histidine kinase